MKKYSLIFALFFLALVGTGFAAETTPATSIPSTAGSEFVISPGDTDNQFFSAFLNTMIMLAVVLILIFIASRFLKNLVNTKTQQANNASDIKIIEKRTLSPKSTLYLLNIKGKEIVIAESHTGISTIVEVPKAQEMILPQKKFSELIED